MDLATLPAGVPEALARLGAATVTVIGSADAKERLRMAEAGQLGEDGTMALRGEVEALTVLLTGLPARRQAKDLARMVEVSRLHETSEVLP